MTDASEAEVAAAAKAILAKVPFGYGMTNAEAEDYARAALTAAAEARKSGLMPIYGATEAVQQTAKSRFDRERRSEDVGYRPPDGE